MSYSDFEFLDITVSEGVAQVLLNRPTKLNTFTAQAHAEVATLYDRLAADTNVRSVVISGAGNAFCAGPDRQFLKDLTSDSLPDLKHEIMGQTQHMVRSFVDFDKPVITAVNGIAMGMGLALAMMADIILVERHVEIREGHITGGLTAGDGAALFWPLSMGMVRAKKYILTTDPMTADEAERFGLISEAVDTGHSLERAHQYAARFAAGPQFAIRSTKKALNQWLRTAGLTSFDYGWSLELTSMLTADAGLAADRLSRGEPGLMPPDVVKRSR